MLINSHEVIMQDPKRPGLDQISIEPPYVTYDEELNELYVYFGSTGTIYLEYLDPNWNAQHTRQRRVTPRLHQCNLE